MSDKINFLQSKEMVVKTVSVKKATYERVEDFMKERKIRYFSPLFDIIINEWFEDLEKKEGGISSQD